MISGNLDVAVLKQIPSGGFSNASLSAPMANMGPATAASRDRPGFTTFDGRGNTTVYFNQNIPEGGHPRVPGGGIFSQGKCSAAAPI